MVNSGAVCRYSFASEASTSKLMT